jgi:hypothetical protein
LENDLGMHGAQLNVALTIFYIFVRLIPPAIVGVG